MRNRTAFDVTFRGVEISDEAIGYVRRCVLRLERAVPSLDPTISITLERLRPGGSVRATVGAGAGHARGEDLDELLALSNAFAVVWDRLGGPPAFPGEPTRLPRPFEVGAAAVAESA